MTDLILVPTPFEMEKLRLSFGAGVLDQDCAFQLCGFGPITAAARAGSLISRYKPARVMLIGIAGSFDTERFPVGTACRYDEVVCDGVGIGAGPEHRSAGEIGREQFTADEDQPHFGDVLPLVSTFVSDVPCAGQLLTCCSASATRQEAEYRRTRYPNAVSEDMEGFGVAVACTLASVPMQIVRGISNRVGDRDKANWRMDEALSAAAQMATRLIERTWIPSQT